MNNKKKILILSIVLLLVVLLVAGGTYAYWTWNSTVNKDVVFNTSKSIEEYIVYDEGDSHFIGDFQPKDSFCQSASNTLSFYKTSEAANVGLVATINMDVNFVGSNIAQSDSVYWVLTSGDNTISCSDGLDASEVINYGTFNGVTNGQTITLESNIEITTTEQKFTVWIWINQVGSDISSLSGETVDVNIWTRIDMLDNSPDAPNRPSLDPGMIPVKIANNGTVTTIASTDQSWYNYSNKEWANAVLVDADSRSTYKGTTGKTINQDDILAYYVWIPRYSYKIPSMTCGELDNPTVEKNLDCYSYTLSQEDKTSFISWWQDSMSYIEEDYGVEYTLERATQDVETMLNTGSVYIEEEDYSDTFTEILSWYNDENDPDITYESNLISTRTTTGPRTIDISFESTESSTLTGDAINTYRTHPAFIWDGNTIAGIWVGKFEATGDGTTPTILPNASSLRSENVSTQFTTSLKFAGGTLSDSIVTFAGSSIYGLTANTDSHMMKNSEWGAVAYLSHSLYGINDEIRINNNSRYTTGCGASEENGSSTPSCQIAYGGATSYPQSTTGNITGVFDMSGGAWEYVMGNYGNTISASGFSVMPSSKYYDLYSSTQFTGDEFSNTKLCTLETCGGHALFETAGWYSDGQYFVDSYNLWFGRGGGYGAGSGAGAWFFTSIVGDAYDYISFRSSAIVGA